MHRAPLMVLLIVTYLLWPCRHIAAAGESPDWPTLQHDYQRTGYTAKGPAPPYRVRWIWASGRCIDPGKAVRQDPAQIDASILPIASSARFMGHAQPMVKNGIAYIGSVEGDLYAIDVKTGETLWKVRTSGQVFHSVSVGDNAVYVGTTSAVDAVSLSGKPLWSFSDPDMVGFWSCPALAKEKVLLGSLAGKFYALDEKTGGKVWEFATGGAIYESPAVAEDKVFFSADDMHAYALSIQTGSVIWKSRQLGGTSFGHYWPVVAAKQNRVIFRTVALNGQNQGAMNAVANAPWDFNKAQEALQKWAGQNPYERTFFALDMATGEEPAVIETGSGGFCQDPAPPPLVRPDGSVLAMHYSKMGAMQKPMKFGGWGDRPEAVWDWSVVNFQTGKFECLGPTDSADHPNAIVRYDDLYQCTMAGDYLYSLHHGGRAGMAPIQRNIGPLFDMNCVYPLGERGIAYLYGRCWIGCVSWTILPDVVLANTTGGAYIIALESAR